MRGVVLLGRRVLLLRRHLLMDHLVMLLRMLLRLHLLLLLLMLDVLLVLVVRLLWWRRWGVVGLLVVVLLDQGLGVLLGKGHVDNLVLWLLLILRLWLVIHRLLVRGLLRMRL